MNPTAATTPVLLALGSNLGDRGERIEFAVAQLGAASDVQIRACSALYETLPIGGPPGQPPFLNAALTLDTPLGPETLLTRLQQIEHQAGRERTIRWGARSLDLDLLLFGEQVTATPHLQLPHPRLSFRRFVLAPASEVAANWRHPTIGCTLLTLWQHLQTAPRVLLLVTADERWARDVIIGVRAALGTPAGDAWHIEVDSEPRRWTEFRPRLIVAQGVDLRGVPCPQLQLPTPDLVTAIAEITAAIQASEP